MADARFFNRTGPYRLARIADACAATLSPKSDPDYEIEDVSALNNADSAHLSFLDNPKYRDDFLNTKAGACIVSQAMADVAPDGVHLLVSDDPYRSYAMAAAMMYPWPKGDGTVSDDAHIHDSARIGKNCTIEPRVVIGADVAIGDDCWIESGAVIGASCVVGQGCRIGAQVTLSHCVMGSHVRIHTGVRIGQEGFGFAMGAEGHLPVPQLGCVRINDYVNIGANTTIDRGSGPDTIIGMGAIIDNLVQIGHNVQVGRGCVVAAQVGISGSTVMEDFSIFGGQAGVAGHLRIGMGARIAAQSGVTKDIPAGEEWVGFPAAPRRDFWKKQAKLKKLLSK